MAVLYAKTAGGNWTDAATWSNVNAAGGDSSGPPTAADDVIFELLSGNVTVNAASVCRSLDCTSGTGAYTGTLTGTASITLTIGDGTAGAGNIALRFSAGMTFTRSASTFTIKFASTSATQQSIYTEGENLGVVTFDGVGGSWIQQDALSASVATIFLTNGAWDTNGQAVSCGTFSSNNSNARGLTLGATTWTLSQFPNTFLANFTNCTFDAGTSTINLTANGDQKLNITGGSPTFYNLVMSGNTGSGSKGLLGSATFNNVTITGSALKTDNYGITGTQTINGTLTINGNSVINRALIFATTLGTPATLTAAVVSITNADFQDITGAGAGSWDLSAISGGSGDCGGNSGITFTTPTTRYWVGGTGSWSDTTEWAASSGGASGATAPLPQDDAVFDANSFSAGSQTCTQNMPRFAKNVNWTGATNSPTWTISTQNQVMYGSLTLISAMTLTQSQVLDFRGRGAFTLTSAGKTYGSVVNVTAFGGSITLQDAFTCSSTFNLNNGTFDSNGFSVSVLAFVTNGSATRTLTMGSSNWSLTGGLATVWNSVGSLTQTTPTGKISITDASATNKLFAGAGKTFNDLDITGGGAGTVTISGANTWRTITVNAPKTLRFTSAVTQIIKRLIAMGSSGNVITINASTAASAATLSQSGGVTAGDWLSIQDITFSPSANATFYAGGNSTNVSGNTGILFKLLPAMSAQ